MILLSHSTDDDFCAQTTSLTPQESCGLGTKLGYNYKQDQGLMPSCAPKIKV